MADDNNIDGDGEQIISANEFFDALLFKDWKTILNMLKKGKSFVLC